MSFDVVSLFTFVPTLDLDFALDLVLQLLANDNTLHDRTSFDISDIKVGLEICLNAAIFTYDHTNYRQIFGLPMRSCISPVLSNIFMEHVEPLAISTFSTPPILWCRYVDDTFCILDKSQTESFHQHLNSVCKHIQFTKAVKFESSLPFLDVLVSRSGNNISTQIYKKNYPHRTLSSLYFAPPKTPEVGYNPFPTQQDILPHHRPDGASDS